MKRIALAVLTALAVNACDIDIVTCEDQGMVTDVETTYEYRYGLNPVTGDFEWSFGPVTKVRCVER